MGLLSTQAASMCGEGVPVISRSELVPSRRLAKPRCDADFALRRSKYENTGHLQLLSKSYHSGVPSKRMQPMNAAVLDRTVVQPATPAPPKTEEAFADVKPPLYKQLIGNTPMVDLSSLSANPQVRIFGKCEFANPSGSIKDRIADHILTRAEQEGKLKPGGTVVAATSGNTGAAVAMIAAMKGYKYIVITNEKTSKEKCDAMRAYGGEVILGPSGVPADHPEHYQNIAVRLCKENADYFDVDQYDNPNNPEAYYRTLGPEIWMQTKGKVTHFVAGGSTGGTISGTGRFLKDMNPDIKVLLPDPVGSVFWDYWVHRVPADKLEAKSYQCEGVGKDSIPGAINFDVVDKMVQVTDQQSFAMCRRLAKTEGMLVGGSAGLNLHAAVEMSARAPPGSVIVAILCDNGVKYLSKVYNDDWIKAKGYDPESPDPQAHMLTPPPEAPVPEVPPPKLESAVEGDNASVYGNVKFIDNGRAIPTSSAYYNAASDKARAQVAADQKAKAAEWLPQDFAGMGI